MRKIALLLASSFAALFLSTAAFAATAAVSWTAPAQSLTGAVTYNLYQGAPGALLQVQTAIGGTTATVTTGLAAGTTVCFAVTAVIGGVESLQSGAACVTLQAQLPNAPDTPIVTIS